MLRKYTKFVPPMKKFHAEPSMTEGETVVIDNGSFECRAGYLGKMHVAFPNRFFKSKDHVSFECVNGYTEKCMFDQDVITNFENAEIIFDHVFSEIKLADPHGLILTEKPFSPNFSRRKIFEMVFELYQFRRFQLGIDSIYSMHKNNVDGPVLVISLSNTCVDAILVDGKIRRVFKLAFGAKQCKRYISMLLAHKYPGVRITDDAVNEMLMNLKVCEDYDTECCAILEQAREGAFVDDYAPSFASGPSHDKNVEGSRLSNFLKTVHAPEPRDLQAADVGGSDDVVRRPRRAHEDVKKQPTRDIEDEFETEPVTPTPSEEECVQGEAADNTAQKGELGETARVVGAGNDKRDKIAYFSLVYRLKQRIAKTLGRLSDNIGTCAGRYEIKTDFDGYLARMKHRLEVLKRDVKRRENIHRELRNKRSVFTRIKNKGLELALDKDEEKIFSQVMWAEDEENYNKLLEDIQECTSVIQKHEPGFEPFASSTLQLLDGICIERRKVPEILFEPSIVNMNGQGLIEVLELLKVKSVFLTGGFSQIAGMGDRLRFEAQAFYEQGAVSVTKAKDPVYDAFHGACFSPLLPDFGLGDYEECGAEHLVDRMEF